MLFDVHAAIDPGQICLGGITTRFVGRCGSKLLNSHEFVVWDGQKPNSRGLCTQHKDSLIQAGMILPNQRSLDPYILWDPGSPEENGNGTKIPFVLGMIGHPPIIFWQYGCMPRVATTVGTSKCSGRLRNASVPRIFCPSLNCTHQTFPKWKTTLLKSSRQDFATRESPLGLQIKEQSGHLGIWRKQRGHGIFFQHLRTYGGFLKWWVSPATMGFLLKVIILGCLGDTTM